MKLNWKKILQYLAMILATLAGGYGGAELNEKVNTPDELVMATGKDTIVLAEVKKDYLIHAIETLPTPNNPGRPDYDLPDGFTFTRHWVYRLSQTSVPNVKQLVYETKAKGAKGTITIAAVYQADKFFYGYEPKLGDPAPPIDEKPVEEQ